MNTEELFMDGASSFFHELSQCVEFTPNAPKFYTPEGKYWCPIHGEHDLKSKEEK